MLEWAWPWLFVLLPVPWLLARILPAARMSAGAALRLPFALPGLEAAQGAAPISRWRNVLALCAWALLVAAVARPQWLGDAQALPRTGRDLLLAVDASGSMSTQDMQIGGQPVSRYSAVKAIAGDFIRRRVGDRLGLIVFGSRAYLLTPLTFDRATVLKQFKNPTAQQEAQKSLAAEPGPEQSAENSMDSGPTLLRAGYSKGGHRSRGFQNNRPETPLDTMAGLLLGSPDFQRR